MTRQRLFLLVIVALLLGSFPAAAAAGPPPEALASSPSNETVPRQDEPVQRYTVEISYGSPEEVAALAKLLPDWDEALEAGSSTIILTDAEIARVRAQGYTVTVVGDAPTAPDVWPACYSHLSELNSWLQVFAADHPTLVELIDYGDSWCKTQGGCTSPARQTGAGRATIWWSRASPTSWPTGQRRAASSSTPASTPARFRRRSWPRRLSRPLVNGYGVDPDITWLLDQREIYVVLSSNPDGRRLVELGAGTEPPYDGNPWYWRKNGNNSIAGSLPASGRRCIRQQPLMAST